LDVWTVKTDELLPVIVSIHEECFIDKQFGLKVYIHGGALNTEDAEMEFNGDFLLDYGVIAVSVNYRLGPLGFLSVQDDPVLTGNQVCQQSIGNYFSV